jgi:hypothetical protein
MCASFAFGGEYGAVEAYQRAFMFGLVPIAFLAIRFLGSRPRVLLPLLVILLFLNIPAQYGSDTFRSATNSQLTGTAFIADKTPDGIYLIGGFTLYIRYHEPTKRYTVLDIGLSPPFTNMPNSTYLNHMLTIADYVLVCDLQHNLNIFYIGRDPLEEANFTYFDRIYDNGGFLLLEPSSKSRD